jgi:trigger factor
LANKRKNQLKIEKEYLDDHQVKLTVEIDSDPFESAKRRAARKIAKSVKIPGFRPGKAPYGVILRQVGEGHIVEQALEILVEEQYPDIIKEAEIEPYGSGSLDNVPKLDPPTFEFVVPLDPSVELGDYKNIEIPFEIPETTDDAVDEAIEEIRKQHGTRESVDRPAEVEDIVFMRISGTRTDVEDEAEAEIVEERFSSSTIHMEEDETEWPFPGFSKELIGITADQEKTIEYVYPDDFEDESLQGAKAEFKIVVTNIQTQSLPAVDDELAQTASEFETLVAWKADLKTNLEERKKTEYSETYDDQILDEIISSSTVKFPPQMVAREKDEILRGLEYRLSQQGINRDLYLQIRGINEEELDDEISPVAEKRIKRALVLMEISKLEEIQADPDQVDSEIGRTIQAISSTMTPNEAKKLAKSDYIPSLASNIFTDMVTQSTMEFLRATAKGEPWPPESETLLDDEEDPSETTQMEVDESEIEDESKPDSNPELDSKDLSTEDDISSSPDDEDISGNEVQSADVSEDKTETE